MDDEVTRGSLRPGSETTLTTGLEEPGGGRAGGAGEPSRGRWSRFSRSHARTAVVGLLGASVAAAYAYFIGCRTGTCPITSNVWTASLYGTVVGGLVGWPVRAR